MSEPASRSQDVLIERVNELEKQIELIKQRNVKVEENKKTGNNL